MQYEITLPRDYDMTVIRNRVAARGHLLDDFAGLAFKAYLVRERGVDDSPVNQYAPFYLWNTVEGMNRFLWGDGFRGLCGDFGRPAVRRWTGLAFHAGPSHRDVPDSACRRTVPVPPGADAATVVGRAVEELEGYADADGAHTAALVVDPERWELVEFTLWVGGVPPEVTGDRYQVPHLSRPELGTVPAGRHW